MSHSHHTEDSCCSSKAHQSQHGHTHSHDDGGEHDHDHGGDPSAFKTYLPALVTLVMLLTG
ncbi:MAG: hypothetical protein ABWZ79_07925, partial [Pedobacter agri]